jgi:hypothetical protein
MAEVAHETQHEFWRPPMQAAPEVVSHQERIQACDRCGTEFIVGSRFCHTCGAERPGAGGTTRGQESFSWARLNSLAERIGLSTGAFLAFVVGIVCMIGAATLGLIFSTRTVLDWQAVQLWRIELLLAAVSAFGAGFLLKRDR